MMITTISSTQLSRAPKQALALAETGDVFVTERGRPAYVLMTTQSYEVLKQNEEARLCLLADAAQAASRPSP